MVRWFNIGIETDKTENGYGPFYESASIIVHSFQFINDAVSNSAYRVSNEWMTVNNATERMWKGAVKAYVVVLTWYSPDGTYKNNDKLQQESRCTGQESKWVPLQYKSDALQLQK
jgi:hypothetical protein